MRDEQQASMKVFVKRKARDSRSRSGERVFRLIESSACAGVPLGWWFLASQHQRMCHLYLLGVRKQMIVDPACEDRRLQGHHPGLGKGLDPGIQLAPGRADLAFPVYMTSHILHAVADRFLVNVKSDVVHIVSEEPPR